ncbi:hypothetical protein HAX54_000114 [Datura stramonium]|uniref:Uncharacterized protein n=1 Tax=Datura stramonium TaxID=4076 RepID=A0ABS8RL06_DATST|nr:hypothetical protein [Datura stramonium]
MSSFQITGDQEMGRVDISCEVARSQPINRSCSTIRQIQQVPTLLRQEEHNRNDYDPQVVSLGPYHHGKPELKLAEEFKTKALEMFVSGSNKDIDFFYNKVLEIVNDARNCYARGSTDAYDDAAFARMMLLNSYYVLFGEYKQKEKMPEDNDQEPVHFLDALRRLLVPERDENSKQKGIFFRPSSTDSLKDIKFQSFYFFGQLELPTSCVSIYTKVLYLNLIAYELCPDNVTDRAVSTYINFMRSLVESPRDVKELREKGILFNMLGSDEEVANVYKELNTHGVNNFRIFQDVKEKIQEHYDSKAKTWIAELQHTYFSSPWNATALLAATFLLCLSFLQTYFTINPSIKK